MSLLAEAVSRINPDLQCLDVALSVEGDVVVVRDLRNGRKQGVPLAALRDEASCVGMLRPAIRSILSDRTPASMR